ncbi:MAG TPA: 2-hydroxychromene-2-carboxylate isomerase [Noviherbaspirillum sp.]|nr:2-hydroxychromene-2-carboxylate isomerase [Noviherbaspirillum sp.]
MQVIEKPQLEFWFEFGSNYSYLSVMRIEAAAREHQVDIVWKPFLLGPIFKELGWESAPFVQQKEKGAYVWRDMERQAAKYGLPFRRPSTFPRVAVLPMRVAVHGAGEPWIGAFCREVMLQNFFHDIDVNREDNVRRALERAHADPDAVLAAATGEENKLRLRRQTEEARRRGIFGAPTFFAGDEMFWGNDRLEDALEWAAGRRAHA